MSYWAVRVDAVVTAGVDVDEGRIEPSEVVEEAMPDLLRDPMALGHGLITVDRDGEGRLERVPQPAQADGPDRLDPRDRHRLRYRPRPARCHRGHRGLPCNQKFLRWRASPAGPGYRRHCLPPRPLHQDSSCRSRRCHHCRPNTGRWSNR